MAAGRQARKLRDGLGVRPSQQSAGGVGGRRLASELGLADKPAKAALPSTVQQGGGTHRRRRSWWRRR